jgi:hypothetical protein
MLLTGTGGTITGDGCGHQAEAGAETGDQTWPSSKHAYVSVEHTVVAAAECVLTFTHCCLLLLWLHARRWLLPEAAEPERAAGWLLSLLSLLQLHVS